jgi:predicted dehydrogenase
MPMIDLVRIGVIGVGSQGRVQLAAFSGAPGVEVTCVCDTDGEQLQRLASEFQIPRATTIPSEVPADDVDAVIVATPESQHLEPTLTALAAGKHVLVEKPLATTVADAHAIAAAASESNRVVFPGFSLRYEPRYRMVKDWLRENDLGAIVSMNMRRNRPVALFERYHLHPALETGSHDVDLALWYTGQRATSVFAVQRRRERDPVPHGIWAIITLEGGAVAMIESVWLTPDAAQIPRNDALELITEKGTALIDIADPGIVFWQEEGRHNSDPIFGPNSLSPVSLSVRAQAEEFLGCIRGTRVVAEASLTDAVHVVEIVDAMIRSADLGQAVAL